MTVCVITVTYGARWHLLRPMLEAVVAHDSRIASVVVVDNGSSYDVAKAVADLSLPQVSVVSLQHNEGSASGYGAGIDAALKRTGDDLLWLLDDDNVPTANSLDHLLRGYAELGAEPRNAMLAIRPRSREYRLATMGLMNVGIKCNSFAGFHLADVPAKIRRRLSERKLAARQRDGSQPLVSVGYAPYGGLLIHRILAVKIGLPRADYFLYADDYEYTTRIPSSGGTIFLCAAAEVHDLETSWHLKPSPVHHFFALDGDVRRLYFSVRNRAQLEAERFVTSKLVYVINAGIYLSVLAAHSLIVDRSPRATFRRLGLVRRASCDGVHGRLGKEVPPAVTAEMSRAARDGTKS